MYIEKSLFDDLETAIDRCYSLAEALDALADKSTEDGALLALLAEEAERIGSHTRHSRPPAVPEEPLEGGPENLRVFPGSVQ